MKILAILLLDRSFVIFTLPNLLEADILSINFKVNNAQAAQHVIKEFLSNATIPTYWVWQGFYKDQCLAGINIQTEPVKKNLF